MKKLLFILICSSSSVWAPIGFTTRDHSLIAMIMSGIAHWEGQAFTCAMAAGAKNEHCESLLTAVVWDATDIVERLLAKKDVTRNVINNLLFLAIVTKKKVKIVELLLAAGADPNAIDKNQYTPLHYASVGNEDKVVELLLRRGANPNVVTSHSLPLKYAVISNKKRNAKRLLESNSNIPQHLISEQIDFLDVIIKEINTERKKEKEAAFVLSARTGQVLRKTTMHPLILETIFKLLDKPQISLASEVYQQPAVAQITN